jgi:hypothetical protein
LLPRRHLRRFSEIFPHVADREPLGLDLLLHFLLSHLKYIRFRPTRQVCLMANRRPRYLTPQAWPQLARLAAPSALLQTVALPVNQKPSWAILAQTSRVAASFSLNLQEFLTPSVLSAQTPSINSHLKSFLALHRKTIAAILGFLFAGIGVAIYQSIPQISEYFRSPKIEVVPQINTDSDITFEEPHAVTLFEADYADLMKEYLWCFVVEHPMFAYYITKGYLSSDELAKMRATRDQIAKQLETTSANIPIIVRIKNNGFRATTIESVEISIPTIGKTPPASVKWPNMKIHLEQSKVEDLNFQIQIPVALLMYGAIIEMIETLTTPQTPTKFKNVMLETMRQQLTAFPFISFDSKGTVVVTDQFKTQYSGTFELRPISELLEKARPPESREQKTTTEAKQQ